MYYPNTRVYEFSAINLFRKWFLVLVLWDRGLYLQPSSGFYFRNLDFQDMSLFRSMILENNDNDLCFVNLLFCQVSIWLDIRLIWTARKCIPLVRNTDNDLPFVKKLQISCSFITSISPFSKIFSIPKWCTKRHNPDVTPNGEKVHPTCKKY